MKTLLRRIRGAVGMGLTWGAGWAPLGALTGWIVGTILGFPLGGVVRNYAILFAMLGFVGGAIFSSVLSLAERRRSFEQLSLPRFIIWGALGGFLLGGLSVGGGRLFGAGLDVLGAVIAGTTTLLGAGSAAGTLAIARAGDDPALSAGAGDRPALPGDEALR